MTSKLEMDKKFLDELGLDTGKEHQRIYLELDINLNNHIDLAILSYFKKESKEGNKSIDAFKKIWIESDKSVEYSNNVSTAISNLKVRNIIKG